MSSNDDTKKNISHCSLNKRVREKQTLAFFFFAQELLNFQQFLSCPMCNIIGFQLLN